MWLALIVQNWMAGRSRPHPGPRATAPKISTPRGKQNSGPVQVPLTLTSTKSESTQIAWIRNESSDPPFVFFLYLFLVCRNLLPGLTLVCLDNAMVHEGSRVWAAFPSCDKHEDHLSQLAHLPAAEETQLMLSLRADSKDSTFFTDFLKRKKKNKEARDRKIFNT